VIAIRGRPRLWVHSGWNIGLKKESIFFSLNNETHGANYVATCLMLMAQANARCDINKGTKTGTEQARVSPVHATALAVRASHPRPRLP
jgi:hypothetical protein